MSFNQHIEFEAIDDTVVVTVDVRIGVAVGELVGDLAPAQYAVTVLVQAIEVGGWAVVRQYGYRRCRDRQLNGSDAALAGGQRRRLGRSCDRRRAGCDRRLVGRWGNRGGWDLRRCIGGAACSIIGNKRPVDPEAVLEFIRSLLD